MPTIYKHTPEDTTDRIIGDKTVTEVKAFPDAEEEFQKNVQIDQTRSKVNAKGLLDLSQEELHIGKTVFPFDFFGTTVRVDRFRVEIKRGTFFASNNYISFLISEINNVVMQSSMFFATLRFEVAGHETNPPVITHLPFNDAKRIKHIIDTIKLATESAIIVANLSKEEILELSRTAGTVNQLANA